MDDICKPCESCESVQKVLTIIENLASVYGDKEVTLKEFIRDVKQARAVHVYLHNSIPPFLKF